MAKRYLTESEWDSYIRDMLKSFAQSALPERGDNIRASKALKLSISAIEQMKSSGKGSIKSWFKLVAYYTNMSTEDMQDFLVKTPTLLQSVGPSSELDQLFEKVKKEFDTQEIAALLQLLLAKRKIEKVAGVKIKVSRNKATTKK